MAHGFNTTKTADGYNWNVTRTVWNEEVGKAETVSLKSGTEKTRARATAAAKTWVLFFRKGGQA